VNGRRAKQVRRLVALADVGDLAAATTLRDSGMSIGKFKREADRAERPRRKRVGLLSNPTPGSWDPAKAADARAKLRRSFRHFLEG